MSAETFYVVLTLFATAATVFAIFGMVMVIRHRAQSYHEYMRRKGTPVTKEQKAAMLTELLQEVNITALIWIPEGDETMFKLVTPDEDQILEQALLNLIEKAQNPNLIPGVEF